MKEQKQLHRSRSDESLVAALPYGGYQVSLSWAAGPPAQIDGWGIRYRGLGAALLSPFRHLSLINTNSSPHRLNISPSGGLSCGVEVEV